MNSAVIGLPKCDTLNPQQLAAVEHGRSDYACAAPLLIIAGAGTGKTNTLAHRVGSMIAAGLDPNRILLLTFSRRAAQEMERRVSGVLSGLHRQQARVDRFELPWAGTFHAIAARLLRDYAEVIGLNEQFTILDRADAEDMLAMARQTLDLSQSQSRFPLKATCLSIYSRVINTGHDLEHVLRHDFPWCAQWANQLKQLFNLFCEQKEAQNVVDYDDLLMFWHEMLGHPEIAQDLSSRFDTVLIDEFQDTNRLQAQILQRLKPDGRGVTAVGDDAQSIYAFRGANVRNMLDFEHGFTIEAHKLALEQNYRSTQPILDASNALMYAAVERHSKTLFTTKVGGAQPQLVYVPDEAEQARWVTQRILEHREMGMQLKDQAVLFRTSSHSAVLELELARKNIPFVKFGGLKFLESAHIKDVLALLRFAQNPRGRLAAFRVLQLLPGIGPGTATRALDAMEGQPSPIAALASYQPPSNARTEWESLTQALNAMTDSSLTWPADLDLALQWYQPHLERRYDDAEVRGLDLSQLSGLARGYGSREQFLSELTLDPPEATSDRAGPPHLDEDYLILSTIHSAKGQEWKSVHILNVVDGCIPSDLSTGSDADVEEERRLLYVAMTRAKEHLHALIPHRFYVRQQAALGDRHVYANRSRFISDRVAGYFERCQWPVTSFEMGRQRLQELRLQSVRDTTRARWK